MSNIENGYRHEKASMMKAYFDIKGDYSGVKMKPDYLDRVHFLPAVNRTQNSDSDISSRTSGMYQASNSSRSMPFSASNNTGYSPLVKGSVSLYDDDDEEERRRAYSF
ncbi:MAG: hypothetical protein AABX04_08640 [Nanoarchaeota archaeon]